MKIPINSHRGYSLIEMLCTMLLFSLFLALTFPYLKASSELTKKVKAKEDFELISERVFQTISEAINNSNSFFAVNSLITHPAETINTITHQKAFTSLLTKYPIAKNNRPLSFMRIIKDLPINIISSNRSLDSAQFIGCMVSSNNNDITYRFYNDQHWLLLSLDGISTMQGRITTTKTKNSCSVGRAVRLDLTAIDSPIFGSITAPPKDNSTFMAYPIEDEFSIYLDQQKALRKLFHRTLVNQKLLSNIDSLVITPLEQSESGGIFKVEVAYKEQTRTKLFASGSSQFLSPLDLIL